MFLQYRCFINNRKTLCAEVRVEQKEAKLQEQVQNESRGEGKLKCCLNSEHRWFQVVVEDLVQLCTSKNRPLTH